MRAAIYARFSSDNQREQSIDDQIRVCRDYAKRENINVLEDHIYFDEATSGSIRNRPGLENLKKAAESKLFDILLIDDSSRLSRDNQYFNTLLCLLQFWGVNLVSVSDGLDSREEHAKVAYQFRGIFNELYLSDLKKKTHRGQMGQVLRGFTIGSLGYGYKSTPVGEPTYDKKGRLRAQGFSAEIILEEAEVVKRIFESFADGKAITQIVKELNEEKVATRKSMRGGWNTSTISRILKNEKFTGKYFWNKCTSLKDPMTGKRKKISRDKNEWVVQERAGMRIISDDVWNKIQSRWNEVEKSFPHSKGFAKNNLGRVKNNPEHLLSGALKCGCCGGSIALVSGKSSGYYGCLNASRKSCNNKVLVSRAKLEKKFMNTVSEKVFKPETINLVFKSVADAIRKQFSHVPEEMNKKKHELNAAEKRLNNFIEYVANGRAPKSLMDVLAETEKKVEDLKADLGGLEKAKETLFEPPANDWVVHKLKEIKEVLETNTTKSALLIRKIFGDVILTPQYPDIGKPYYQANSKLKTANLLDSSDKGSNTLQWWRWGDSAL